MGMLPAQPKERQMMRGYRGPILAALALGSICVCVAIVMLVADEHAGAITVLAFAGIMFADAWMLAV